jgi:toxin ParE1/3/4
MKRLVFTPAARNDLLEIGAYIADDNPVRAESFVTELETKAYKAAERPRSFPERTDIGVGLRAAVHGRYLLLFRELDDEVRIVRIIHGGRNIPSLFD